MPVYLKVVGTEWKSATHDQRELKVAKELGYETLVIATKKEARAIFQEKVDEFDVIRIPTRRYGDRTIGKLCGRIWAIFSMIHEVRKVNADIISGHNFEGWLIGYCGRSKRKRAKLIYDSHEFELYQDGSTKTRYHIIKRIEKFIFKHTDLTYTVTDGIATELKKIYQLKDKPLVVRNIPEKIEFDRSNVKKYRIEFMANLKLDEDGLIMMYHGGFASGRGLEQALSVVESTQNVGLVMMGFALDEAYFSNLKRRMKTAGIESRVYIKPAVGFPALYENVAAADVGIVLSRNTCINHFYSLPNKLFECIQAGTPVIASNFPEIAKIVDGYSVGVTIDPEDIKKMIEVVEYFRGDAKFHRRLKEGLKHARDELCWQKEKEALKTAISNL